MAILYLVRHGQASFGAADYDQLSPQGIQQCRWLGEHWRALGWQFDAVMVGGMRRHQQSLAAIAEGLEQDLPAVVRPGLNEYDFEAVMRAALPDPSVWHPQDMDRKQHFRLLRDGLLGWMQGSLAPHGLPAHADFLSQVLAALDEARDLAPSAQARVLVVSSGGPISNAVGHLLQTSAEGAVNLNLRLRNSAVTELVSQERGHSLVSFNAVPHLERADRLALQTYA